jgi:hypothetical protein
MRWSLGLALVCLLAQIPYYLIFGSLLGSHCRFLGDGASSFLRI